MKHLSDDELRQAVEGVRVRDDHVGACEACREEIETLSALLAEVKADAVPEPSPLFWNHFTERVARAAREDGGERAVNAAAPWRGWAWRAVAFAAVAGALVLAVVTSFHRETPAVAVARLEPARGAVAAPVEVAALGDDESWDTFSDIVADAESTGDSISLPAPGGAERDVVHMTDDERAELARLLEQELARQGAHGRV